MVDGMLYLWHDDSVINSIKPHTNFISTSRFEIVPEFLGSLNKLICNPQHKYYTCYYGKILSLLYLYPAH